MKIQEITKQTTREDEESPTEESNTDEIEDSPFDNNVNLLNVTDEPNPETLV